MGEKEKDKLVQGVQKPVDRRSFVKGVGIAGVGVAGATFLGGKLGLLNGVPGAKALGLQSSVVHAQSTTGPSDTDILNFALQLEYLEAEFYTVATTGQTIEASGIPVTGLGTQGPTYGGHQVNFTGVEGGLYSYDRADRSGLEVSHRLRAIAEELAFDERQHVLDLRAALGSAAVAKPTIDLDALGFGFGNFREFLRLARSFEDVGVSAYGYAAPLITSKTYLAAAVRIALAEGLHSGDIRLLVAENDIQTTPVDGQDVLPPPSGTQYFTLNAQALSIVRSPSEVLAILFGSATPGTDKGGFFPDGVNGNINTV